jgi:hypothetical protein
VAETRDDPGDEGEGPRATGDACFEVIGEVFRDLSVSWPELDSGSAGAGAGAGAAAAAVVVAWAAGIVFEAGDEGIGIEMGTAAATVAAASAASNSGLLSTPSVFASPSARTGLSLGGWSRARTALIILFVIISPQFTKALLCLLMLS